MRQFTKRMAVGSLLAWLVLCAPMAFAQAVQEQSGFDWWAFIVTAAPFAFNAVTNIASFYAGQKNSAKQQGSAVDKTTDALVMLGQTVAALTSIAAAAQAAQRPGSASTLPEHPEP